MESKHDSPTETSPSPYVEDYRGFALTLEFRQTGEVRALAEGPITWATPFGASWISQLERIREFVDRYLRLKAFGRPAYAVGAVERPDRHLVVGAAALDHAADWGVES